MPSSHPSAAGGPARRTVLAAAVAAAGGLTGCDLPDRRAAAPRRSPTTPSPSATSVAPGTVRGADRALLDEVVAQTLGVLAVAESMAQRRGRRARPGRVLARTLADLHRAHLEVLDPDGGTARSSTVPRGAGRAELLAGENTYAARLRDAALACQSGLLARVLASMHAAVLVTAPDTGSGGHGGGAA